MLFGRRHTGESTRAIKRYPDGYVSVKGHWMNPALEAVPTVFLVEQQPDVVAMAHFHRNNQFQVFVDGSGRMGPRKVGPVVVHYAGAYTAYGPITANSEGLTYFTLRMTHEDGALPAVGSDTEWQKGPRRHFTSQALQVLEPQELAQLAAVEQTVVLPKAQDGLAILLLAVPPFTAVEMPPQENAAGRFIVLLEGALKVQDVELSRWESVALSHENLFTATGAQGTHLLVLDMPPLEAAYH